jgi:hypothetical protein
LRRGRLLRGVRYRGRQDARWPFAALWRWLGFRHRRISNLAIRMINYRAKPQPRQMNACRFYTICP